MSRVPPNVRFQIDDATQEWAFPQNSFDFIHIRCLAGSIRDWPEFLRQSYKYHSLTSTFYPALVVLTGSGVLYRHLKPGGRIEVSEGRPHMCCDDDSFPEDCE